MRFGNAIKAVSSAFVERATTRRQRFLEIITANDQYTPPPATARTLLELYNSNLWVRAIVGKIGKSVAKQKWYLERENGERVDKHPALDFLNKGVLRLPGRLGRQITAVHMDLAGEAFWAIGLGANGLPVNFAPIPPHWVSNIPETDGKGEVYEVQPKQGTLFRIPANQIIHFRDPDPLDPYARGSSYARPARVELDSDGFAANYLASFFKNSARPDLIVSGSKERPMSDTDRGRLEETWTERFRGVNRAFKPFFSAQPIEIKELSRSLRDNNLSEVRDQLKATVAEYYGIPPEILGRLENSNRATIDAADLLFSKFVIDPRLGLMLDVLEPFVAERFGLDGLALRYETPVQDDKAFKLSVMQARPGAYADNDFRTLAGDKPLDGDEFDKPRPDPIAAANDIASDPDGDPDGDAPPPKGGKKPAKKDPKADAPPKKGVEAKQDHVAGDRAVATEQRKSISPEDIISVSDAHMDPAVVAEATKIMDAIFLKLLETYGEELLGVLESEVRFQVNGAVAEWLAERGSRLISGVDKTTRDALRASIVEGAAANESVAALAERIEAIFDDAASIRGPLIGQTEATAVTGFGSLEAARQAGFDQKKWLTSGDHVVRDTHRAMNGQIKQLSEKFRSPSGAQADHPGAFGSAKEDINCRCAIRPVLSGEVQRAAGLTDTAFEAAWDGMHAHVARAIETEIRSIFSAQKRVALAALNSLTRGAVYA